MAEKTGLKTLRILISICDFINIHTTQDVTICLLLTLSAYKHETVHEAVVLQSEQILGI